MKHWLELLFHGRARRTAALTLAVLVTFTTVYSLVLPAITLEKEIAETMSGVSLGGNEQGTEPADTLDEGAAESGAPAEESTDDPAEPDAEANGAEQLEPAEEPSFRSETENGPDQEDAGPHDMAEQPGEGETPAGTTGETPEEDESEEENNADVPEEAVPDEEETEEPETTPCGSDPGPGECILTAQDASYLVTVTCGPEARVPQGTSLRVEEIPPEGREYENHLEETRKALYEEALTAAEEEGTYAGPDAEEPQFFGGRSLMADPGAFDRRQAAAASVPEPEIDCVRIFDISIRDETGEKVQIAAPVEVEIELRDEDGRTAENARVVHIPDGAETGDVIEDVETGGGVIRFAAPGFSAYAIVEGPGEIPVGWSKVSSVDQLLELGSKGLYVGNPNGYYFMNTLAIDSKRTGITKTKPAQSYPADDAALYYFEPVEGTEDQVYAYCYAEDGETKQYVFNGGNNNLSFTTEENKTAFTVSMKDGFFTLQNGAWYWNMQGGDNGSRFCSWNTAGDVNNRLDLWYYSTADEDPYRLDGCTYGLMNWGGGVAGKALMADSAADNTLEAKALTVMSTTNNSSQLFVPNDSDISMWTFRWISGDQYYLTADVDGSTKYLRIGETGISLVSGQGEASRIQVVPGSGIHAGEICLRSGSATLTFSGTVSGGFSVGGSAGSEWLNLVSLSELTKDYFRTYSAGKVSVSDESVTNGSRVIVYTRSWNERKLAYDYYAISADGSLVPVYESGNSIEWVGGQLNSLLWNFVEHYWEGTTDPNYYYELYNQYSEQYIAPRVTGGQILSEDPIGINLNGRRDGQYYSTILAWDDDSYSYVGLKVEDGQIVTCPKSEAMHFYFAIMEDLNIDDDLHTVPTLDHTQYGITMKIIDLENAPNNKGDMSTFLGSNEGGAGTNLQQGLLSTNLGTDGYPTAVRTNRSLSGMYSGNGLREVNHLFIESTYRNSGYFEFDSTQNYAFLEADNNFKVYKELGSYDSAGGRNTLKHGQFFPFNDLETGTFTSVNGKNLYTFDETNYQKPLPDSDPRKYEQLYSLENSKNSKVDPYFAVELEAGFTQTESGEDAWGHDIIFEFTGDDDFWLYVDGELVIDLGGIHSSVPGSVNFKTGVVKVNGTETTLRELFQSNFITRYKAEHEGEEPSEEQIAAHLSNYFEGGSTVFKDDTNHTMNIFYMERGAGASNLHMRFNLAAVKKGTVQLTKTLSGVDQSESVMAEFPYQIIYRTKEDPADHYLTNAAAGGGQNGKYVFYKDTVNPVKYQPSVTIDGITYRDVFFLKPGETADITFPEGMTTYRIVECGVNTEGYANVSVNGQELAGSDAAEGGIRKDYGIEYATTDKRPKVKYENEVKPDALRTLTIQKALFREDGITPISAEKDGTEFAFRLYLASEFDDLAEANMHTYHVRDPEGFYCSWDNTAKKFVRIGEGVTDYASMTPEQKKASSFTTSIYGSIGRIPSGYTVEIRNVLAGTKFRAVEQPQDIPDGYSFQKYVYNGTESENGAAAGIADTVSASRDPSVVVRNLKGWGLRINKVWRDADYMASRDPAYFAVFTKSGDDLTLVEGSVRQLPYEASPQTLYWYFPHLPVENTEGVGDYLIREVTISEPDPVIGEDGTVTAPGTVTPLDSGYKLTLNGTQKGETGTSDFLYTVHYEPGETSSDSNVRVDTVTNDRPGIILKKQDWDGKPLAGAVFSLTDSGGNTLGTFTSDESGFISTAFLSSDKEYTLTETKTPHGWHGLETAMKIRVTDGTVTVDGPNEGSYTLTQAEGTTLASIVIKNRPYTFRAVKEDGDTHQPMEGVTFALHEQKTVDGVIAVDVDPMPGYESLVTDGEGVIPLVDTTLPPGTYELREKTTLAGYEKLPGHIRFTVSQTGMITLDASPEGVSLTGEPEPDGTLGYLLTVRNFQRKKVSFRKVDIADPFHALDGAVFDLYALSGEGEAVSRQTPALYTGLTAGADGLLRDGSGSTVFALPAGSYHLVETEPPEGYDPKAEAVTVTVTASDVSYDEGTTLSGSGTGVSYDSSSKVYTLLISNSAGYALPSTGGPGTHFFPVLGTVLIAGAGALLWKRRGAL